MSTAKAGLSVSRFVWTNYGLAKLFAEAEALKPQDAYNPSVTFQKGLLGLRWLVTIQW